MGHIAGTLGNGGRRRMAVEWHGVLQRAADDAFPNSNEALP